MRRPTPELGERPRRASCPEKWPARIYSSLLRMWGTTRVGNLDAAILRSARVRRVIGNRLGLAKAFGCKPVADDSVLGEPGIDSLGARFRQRLVVGIAAHVVRVSLDLDLLRGILLQQIQNLLQYRIAGGLK